MKNRFLGILIWLLLFSFVLAGSLGINLTKAQADALPTVQFVTTTSTDWEKISNPVIDVTLSEISAIDVTTVDYTVTSGDAIANDDYILANGTLNIPAGQLSNNIPLKIIDNKKFDLINKSIEITLSNPVNLSLSNLVLGSNQTFIYTIIEDNTPTTILTKDPAAALGLNGWFTVTPEITLTADRAATIYYQWDGYQDDTWQVYLNSFSALKGDHTLYFYTDDGNGFIETLQSETFKVDTMPPITPVISAVIDNQGAVHLSWLLDADVSVYQIWRSGVKIATLPAGSVSYIDTNPTINQTYDYQLMAFDQAGNQAASLQISIKVAVVVIIQEVPVVQTVAATPSPKIKKAITSGRSITAQKDVQTSIPEVISGATDKINQPASTESTEPTNENTPQKDWSRILLLVSILIIAAGIIVGGYYGYEWYLNRRDGAGDNNPKNKSRW